MRKIETFREDEVIYCTTAAESASIWKLLNGIKRNTIGDRWNDRPTNNICYCYHNSYGSVEYYKANGYTIIPAQEFLENNTTITTEDELLLL